MENPLQTNQKVKRCITKGKRCKPIHDLFGCYCKVCGYVYHLDGSDELPSISFSKHSIPNVMYHFAGGMAIAIISYGSYLVEVLGAFK